MRSVVPSAPEADETRYIFERTLGQGGAGAVYLVKDRETGEQLALKKLLHVDAKAVLRLKREFRSLADVHHPNLVKLYDLGRASDAWFLTMEYVDGTDLLTYVEAEAGDTGEGLAGALKTAVSQRNRVVPAFHQLALGVRALHRAGMLHRDLKPSNVLVSGTRVVVLDFGLVRELDRSAAAKVTEDGSIAGTPAYMAPEQALGKELSEACDWYAFGVMLYEALSGALPFDGTPLEVLRLKLDFDATPLDQVAPNVPRPLRELCARLLLRDPAQRPSGEEIVRALEPKIIQHVAHTPPTGETTLFTDNPVQPSAAPLFGREAELAQLWEAFERASEERTVLVHVRGASGAGKSALVEHFLGQVAAPGRSDVALVLRSRCYEREAMPFKALDGALDALVRHLAELEDFEVGHLLPSEIAALTRLFPALERLHAVQRLLAIGRPQPDAVQDRDRAVLALRELFTRLAARRPLVLWIDDLQWGDLDSARILKSWLSQPIPGPILLVFSYRSDEVDTSPCLQAMRVREAGPLEHSLDLPPLANDDVQALCGERLGAHALTQPELVARIAREAQGSPFLAFQLAALAEAKLARGDADLHSLSVGELVEQTSSLLPTDAQALLRVLAVAGRPMLPKLALRAAAIRREGRSILHALRGLNLVRTRDVGGERLVEIYHDRVREGVSAALSGEERVRVHEGLLRAIEFSGQADPDWLYALALGAGQRAQALRYGLIAAERASTTLAFERAAELYRQCVELAEDPAANSGELWRKLAVAQASCGRGHEAGAAYLEAAKCVSGAEAVSLTRQAASHLLRSGRFAEGDALVRKVLAAMEIDVPETDRGMIAAILWEKTRLSLRGTGYVARREAELPASLLERVDLYDALRVETQTYAPLRAVLFQMRGLRLALEAGEPARVVRALCSAAQITVLRGTEAACRKGDEILARASALAAELRTERELATVCSARAMCAFMLGRWSDVLEPASEAERIYRAAAESHGTGDYYRRQMASTARIGALHMLGQNQQFASELAATLAEARATDNISVQLHLMLNQTLAEEVSATTDRSLARLAGLRELLPEPRFGILHALYTSAVMRATCSSLDFDTCDALLGDVWERFERSPVRNIPVFGFSVRTSHAALLINRRVRVAGTPDPTRAVEHDMRELGRLPMSSAQQYQQRMFARLALLSGERPRAVELLRASSSGFGKSVPAEGERDRYALGILLGGSEGDALCSQAQRGLTALGYADPVRFVAASYPELVGPA
ncbi:MAG TPA: protein kinase [Polyangiales bacterium]|nr:protein kinase [Polyangiales bacterium]